jgi:hypothetical protein
LPTARDRGCCPPFLRQGSSPLPVFAVPQIASSRASTASISPIAIGVWSIPQGFATRSAFRKCRSIRSSPGDSGPVPRPSARCSHLASDSGLHLPHHLPSLLAVHLVPMVLCWMVGCSFVLLLWLGSHANLPVLNSTWLGPVGENHTISPAGSGRSPFQDNARRHLHNRQNRSHAPSRAGTLQGKCGLSCHLGPAARETP